MQFKVVLSEVWDECPLAFRNMLGHIDDTNNDPNGCLDNIKDIKRELRNFGGRYCINSDTIIFPTEANYMSWILKWG
jgi:hypothetical protein